MVETLSLYLTLLSVLTFPWLYMLNPTCPIYEG